MKVLRLAALISTVLALIGFVIGASTGTREARLMNQGLFLFYWIVSFLFIGLPAAAAIEAYRDVKEESVHPTDAVQGRNPPDESAS